MKLETFRDLDVVVLISWFRQQDDGFEMRRNAGQPPEPRFGSVPGGPGGALFEGSEYIESARDEIANWSSVVLAGCRPSTPSEALRYSQEAEDTP